MQEKVFLLFLSSFSFFSPLFYVGTYHDTPNTVCYVWETHQSQIGVIR